MKWTSEIPKKKGYFWWRDDADISVVRINWIRGQLTLNGYAIDTKTVSGQFWSERILPPEEKE